VIAYVDESLRLDGEGRYVLAAVLVPDARADEVRAVLRSTLRAGQRRFHWHDEGPASRAAMVGVVAGLGLHSVVVTVTPVDPRSSERARRRCLRQLLWELDQRAVRTVVLESRQRRDASDRTMISHAVRTGWASAALQYSFDRPKDECLLWLADIVAGAVAADRTDAALLRRMSLIEAR
jgi:uncharacterized protein with von Willebrand factor type A (vWA) domain